MQVSKLLAKLSTGEGKKWVTKHSQVLMAITLQDYLFPLFRPVLYTRLSEQHVQAVGVLPTHGSQSCLLTAVDFSGTQGRKNEDVTQSPAYPALLLPLLTAAISCHLETQVLVSHKN